MAIIGCCRCSQAGFTGALGSTASKVPSLEGYDSPDKLHPRSIYSHNKRWTIRIEHPSKFGLSRSFLSSLSMCDPTPRRVLHVARRAPGRPLKRHITI